MLFRYIKYKFHQLDFCRKYISRSKELTNYKWYLKHLSKKDSLPSSFIDVSIYDLLDNDGMNCLIKKVYKLKSKNKYKVYTPFIKHTFKKVNYINSNITGRQTGRIAEIEFKDNKWIKSINIHYTYVNTSEVVVEYQFVFRKVMTTYLQIHNFVVENIFNVKKKGYFHNYADKSIIKKADYSELCKLDYILFADIIQAYVCTYFYTRYGVKYKLPIEYALKIKNYNKKKSREMKNSFLCECYKKEKSYLIVSDLNYGRFEAAHYISNKYLPRSFLLKYFTDFSMEMYYKTFCKIELEELEIHMRKYLNSNRSFVSAKDIKWLVNKIRYIRESKEKINHIYEDIPKQMLDWKCYVHGKLMKTDFINFPTNLDYFLKLYQQNLDYLNSIASVQNNKIVIIVSVFTLIATVVGVIISLCG
ncbi:MAG: hypothetical protein IJ433_06345 [Ruminococcus sp.]|nr:hypothetical protein [Ruminococcus sp.]